MNNQNQRSELLMGSRAMEKLKNATVMVVGTGGVGSFAAEALIRTGVGSLILIDKDVVEPSNINRQLVARRDTIGQSKVEVLKKHAANLNPDIQVTAIHDFYDASMNEKLKALRPDYILDCIDSVDSKKDLILFALDNDIPIISSMGMARKKDPGQISVMELEKTSYDPIAKILRIWKRKNKIRKKIQVVSSTEPPVSMEKGSVLPSAIFVPATAGLAMANKAVLDLAADTENEASKDGFEKE
ncbi:MAG: ThiF family adenylyltransferase [Erysipelotrichaceae bacterium]|nr:ThiF family adenylyltransferase [Erysipelotrichaceae bacterium]